MELNARIVRLGQLLAKVEPVPGDWLGNGGLMPSSGGGTTNDQEMGCVPCASYRQLVNVWRRALRWTDGLDHALAVMLASIASTKTLGDQLWVKVIGPASCGKSTLCEAVSVARRYVLAKSTIRGFHSGYQTDRDGAEDNSLVAQLNGMTLVTKDGDTLLQAPNLPQILAEGRDLYDTTARTHYRNKTSRDYSGIRFTWLLCGTNSLRAIDHSELGERFLDCVIMDGIDDELEDEILMRVAHRAERTASVEADSKATTHQDADLTAAMQLTGGYVDYLRDNATELLGGVVMDDAAKHLCTRLGKFVAYMRARPSLRQDELAEREFAARLVSQHIRLAKCLAAVLNRATVDGETMARTARVALDTSRGHALSIARTLHAVGRAGMGIKPLLHYVAEEKTRAMLRFLERIGVVERFDPPAGPGGLNHTQRWRLTARLTRLFDQVHSVTASQINAQQ